MGNIVDGLIIPFKFYDSYDKKERFRDCGRYDVEDIAHNEYLISYGCRLLPFQIKRVKIVNDVDDFELSVINVNSGVETDLTSYIDSTEWDIYTSGEYDYLSYYGNADILDGDDCVLSNCVYYAVFTDGVNTWYSVDFKVVGIDNPETFRRLWSDSNLRISETGNTRIWK